jgi:hypothetical protein
VTTAANIFFEPTLTDAAKLSNARLTACFGSIEQPHNHIAVPEDQHENRYDNGKHAFGYGLIRDRDIGKEAVVDGHGVFRLGSGHIYNAKLPADVTPKC